MSTIVYRTELGKFTKWGILTSKNRISSYRYAKKGSKTDFDRKNSAQSCKKRAVGQVASSGTVFRFDCAQKKNEKYTILIVEFRDFKGTLLARSLNIRNSADLALSKSERNLKIGYLGQKL